MAEQTGHSKLEAFAEKVRGSKGELGLLVRLVGHVQHQWEGSQRKGLQREAPAPTTERAVGLLKTRIAQLSRSSEIRMREAAMNIGRIGKALQEQKASPEMVRHFGPILVVLQKQIDHSMRKVQASKSAVQGLDRMFAAGEAKGTPSAADRPTEPAGARRQKQAPAAGARGRSKG